MVLNRAWRCRGRWAVLLLLSAGLHVAARGNAQTGPLSRKQQALQAKSQDELDAYLEVVTATDPHEILRLANSFESSYPSSDLVGIVYESQMHAFGAVGDLDRMLDAGRKALAAQPGNLNTLLTLAPAMVNHAEGRKDRAELLNEAGEYAREALAAIARTRPPHEVSIEQWEAQSSDMQRQAHEVLGTVALALRRPGEAAEEFSTVIRLARPPGGAQFFRLGAAYSMAGREKEAEQAFKQAAALGPEDVRKLAREQLKTLPSAAPNR